MSSSKWILFLCLLACLLYYATSEDQINITAEPGDTVTLTCRVHSNDTIIAVEWSRADLEPEYVFFQRGSQSDPENQHPSFKNRVELKDKQMKDGDVSLILKNVTINDTGTYECCVFPKGSARNQRAVIDTDPISIINLTVEPGHTDGNSEDGEDSDRANRNGHVGLVISLSLFAVLLGILSFMYIKKNP